MGVRSRKQATISTPSHFPATLKSSTIRPLRATRRFYDSDGGGRPLTNPGTNPLPGRAKALPLHLSCIFPASNAAVSPSRRRLATRLYILRAIVYSLNSFPTIEPGLAIAASALTWHSLPEGLRLRGLRTGELHSDNARQFGNFVVHSIGDAALRNLWGFPPLSHRLKRRRVSAPSTN
jgi:hypothetical protein